MTRLVTTESKGFITDPFLAPPIYDLCANRRTPADERLKLTNEWLYEVTKDEIK
jgi:hypothetical protein